MNKPITKAALAALAALALGGCEPGGEGTDRTTVGRGNTGGDAEGRQTASNYPDSAGTPGTHLGTELEAPALLLPLETSLRTISTGSASTENLTSYRNLLSEVGSAMMADLSRREISPDTLAFRARIDSLLMSVGGGAGGEAPEMSPEQVDQHATRVRRLVADYRELMGIPAGS